MSGIPQGCDKTCLLCGEENDDADFKPMCVDCEIDQDWPPAYALTGNNEGPLLERDRDGGLHRGDDVLWLVALWRLEVRIRQVARCATISSPTSIEALRALGFRKDRVLDKLAQMEREARDG